MEQQQEPVSGSILARMPQLSAERKVWWRRHVRPKVLFASSIILGLVSLLLLWSELTIVSQNADVDLSPFHYIVRGLEDVPLLQQIFTDLLLLYLFICTAYPVFHVRISSLYYCGPHHTDTNSLVYNATVLLRVSISLAYNFQILLALPAGALEALLGPIADIPFFGTKFNTVFPIFMAVWAFLILVHAISRLMKLLNIERFQFITNSAEQTGELSDSAMEVKSQILEGQGLIKQEKRKRDRARESGQTYEPHLTGGNSPGPSSPTSATGSTSFSASSQPGGASGYRGRILDKKDIKNLRASSSSSALNGGDKTARLINSSSGDSLSDGSSLVGGGRSGQKYKGYGKKDNDERKGFLDE